MQHTFFTFVYLFSILLTFASSTTINTLSGETITPLCYNPTTDTLAYADSAGIIHSSSLRLFDTSHHHALKKFVPDAEQWRNWNDDMLPEPESFPPVPPAGLQLIGWDKSDRAYIQSFNQSDYGNKASDCVPNSFVNTAQWWDVQKFVEFPQKRTEEKQIEWLHTIISRAAGTRNNSGTYYSDLRKALTEISKRYLNDQYLFPCFCITAPTLEKMAFYSTGNTAACLSLSVYYKDKYQSGHAVTLIGVTADGKIKLNTWGEKLSGMLKPIELQDNFHTRTKDAQAYEIELYNQNELPDWMIDYEVSLRIEPARQDNLYLFLPYKKLKTGDLWTDHPESFKFTSPSLQAPTVQPSTPQPSYKPEPTIPFSIAAPPLLATWQSPSGKTMRASLKTVNGNSLSFNKGRNTITLPLDRLAQESQCHALFWDGANGNRRDLPACTLNYLLKPNITSRLSQKVTIHYDGSQRAIINLPQLNRRIDFNNETQTFTVYRNSPLERIAEGSPTIPGTPPRIEAKELYLWHPAKVHMFAGRFLQSSQFPSGRLTMANISAPPVAALLAILNGQHLHYTEGHFGYKFPDFKINCFSEYQTEGFELERALNLAHHWEMLPLQLHWKSKVHNLQGKLELINIKPLAENIF